ncbi:MAG: hypothetical protein ACLQQ4_10590 [Bacteroidia bacterium]
MKTKHFLITGMIGIALAGMIITGCKKEATVDTDSSAAQDDANASSIINDSKNISDGAAKGQATERPEGSSTCGTWVKSDTTIAGVKDTVIYINFPSTGSCQSPDGKIRHGQIIVMWNGKGYFDSAASITMTWRNYSITNGATTITIANGSYRTLTNTGKDSLGDHSWSFNANLTFTYSGGSTGTATWTSNRTNTLTYVPVGTKHIWYYVVTGGASGTSKTGVSYSLTITQPLYWTAFWLNGGWLGGYCNCFEQGQVEYTRSGKQYPLYLTFTSGLGNCLYTATATINGNSYPISLL